MKTENNSKSMWRLRDTKCHRQEMLLIGKSNMVSFPVAVMQKQWFQLTEIAASKKDWGASGNFRPLMEGCALKRFPRSDFLNAYWPNCSGCFPIIICYIITMQLWLCLLQDWFKLTHLEQHHWPSARICGAYWNYIGRSRESGDFNQINPGRMGLLRLPRLVGIVTKPTYGIWMAWEKIELGALVNVWPHVTPSTFPKF